MKKIPGIVLIFLTIISFAAKAQMNFAYDKAGNRTKSQLIVELLPDSVNTLVKQESRTPKTTLLQQEHVDVYPNPASDRLIIDTKSQEAYRIRLYDMQGKQVLEKESSEMQQQIEISALQNGYYILEVKSKYATNRWKILKQ